MGLISGKSHHVISNLWGHVILTYMLLLVAFYFNFILILYLEHQKYKCHWQNKNKCVNLDCVSYMVIFYIFDFLNRQATFHFKRISHGEKTGTIIVSLNFRPLI